MLFKRLVTNTFHLFYPHICTGCGADILDKNTLLCAPCISNLSHTNFAWHANNPVEKIFWGRVPITAAFSEFYFYKESLIQQLIHELKYKGNRDIGFYLGECMGKSVINSHRFLNIDAIIPLPLFAAKEHRRGYNQAKILSDGLAATTRIPVINDVVIRRKLTETQTKKHRAERWENVVDSFWVNNPALLEDKTLLLVDDVVTTGATLEACASTLLQVKNVKISIATLALATK